MNRFMVEMIDNLFSEKNKNDIQESTEKIVYYDIEKDFLTPGFWYRFFDGFFRMINPTLYELDDSESSDEELLGEDDEITFSDGEEEYEDDLDEEDNDDLDEEQDTSHNSSEPDERESSTNSNEHSKSDIVDEVNSETSNPFTSDEDSSYEKIE